MGLYANIRGANELELLNILQFEEDGYVHSKWA